MLSRGNTSDVYALGVDAVPPSPRTFIGFDNYTELFDNQFFREAVWVSVVMTVASVFLSLLFGTMIALLLDRPRTLLRPGSGSTR